MGNPVADGHRQSAPVAFGFGYAGHACRTAAARQRAQRSCGDGQRGADRIHFGRPLRDLDRISDRGEPVLCRSGETAAVLRVQHPEINLPADVHPGVRRRLFAKGRVRIFLDDLHRHHVDDHGRRIRQGRTPHRRPLLRGDADANRVPGLSAEHAAGAAGSAADFDDLQSHRRHSRGDVCLARWHRPSDRDLGRELSDEATARRRRNDRRDCHDIQRTGQISRNTMQPLANVTPLKPVARAGAIKVSNVSQVFKTSTQDVVALSDISLEVKPGRFVVLVGPSGCGKSTLLMMMAGLRQQTAGTILINDAPIPQPDPNRVGVVFQEPSLFPWLTAEENVEFPLALRGVAKPERRAKAEDALKLVGLEGFGKRHPHELSGGMKQRVSIARGLVQDPPVLLMDEPFAALDEQTRMTMGDELLRIWAATGKTVVFVTHSLTEAVYLADEVMVMSPRPGRIVDHLQVSLPRPRTYEMMATDVFGRLRDRIWQQIRKAE